jgi:hypothetical protein
VKRSMKKELALALIIAISLGGMSLSMAKDGAAGNGHNPASGTPGLGNGQADGKGLLCPNGDGGDLIKECTRTGPMDEEGNPTWICSWECEVCEYSEPCEE